MTDEAEQYDLSELWKTLANAAESLGIFLVSGIPQTKVHWNWDGEEGGEREFIDLAARLSVPVIYHSTTTFLMAAQATRALIEAEFESIDDEDLDYSRLLKRLERKMAEWKKYDGRMAEFTMRFTFSGIVHELSEQVDWFLVFQDDLAQSIAELEVSLAEKIEKSRNKARNDLKEKAGQIARDPRYARAKNASLRRYLFDEMIPNLNANDRWNVEHLASAIFADEVLPEIEKGLIAQVKELRKQGHSGASIRAHLGVSKERADRLIVLSESEN